LFLFICSLLDQIPQTFANTKETETILAPVIQSGIQALKVRFEKRI
jgi:protein transport protein SEC24